MIIKILSSTGTFAGVKYNTDKVKNDRGELMQVANIPHVDGLNISESECKEYFIAHSSVNKRIKNAQFHAVISADGKQLDKYQLTEIAEKYLERMGYSDNPYIVVFHNDTENNHVHIVSSRVGNDGKKIDHTFENLRTNNIRLELMKEYSISSKEDLELLLSYSYQSPNQLVHLLKSKGYVVSEKDNDITIYNNGQLKASLQKDSLPLQEINKKRAVQIKAFFKKYGDEFSGKLEPVYEKLKGDRLGKIVGYRSDLGDFLKNKFGLEIYYHFADDKKPYGYTVFDHADKNIFKGSDILKLALMVNEEKTYKQKEHQSKQSKLLTKVNAYNISSLTHIKLLSRYYKVSEHQININNILLSEADKNYYKVLLDHHFSNDTWSNLKKLQITPLTIDGELLLLDKSNLRIIDAKDCLDREIIETYYDQGYDEGQEYIHDKSLEFDLGWDIADDEDDELAHGKKRSKGKKRN